MFGDCALVESPSTGTVNVLRNQDTCMLGVVNHDNQHVSSRNITTAVGSSRTSLQVPTSWLLPGLQTEKDINSLGAFSQPRPDPVIFGICHPSINAYGYVDKFPAHDRLSITAENKLFEL